MVAVPIVPIIGIELRDLHAGTVVGPFIDFVNDLAGAYPPVWVVIRVELTSLCPDMSLEANAVEGGPVIINIVDLSFVAVISVRVRELVEIVDGNADV